jgi:hypothetical protein
MHKPILYVLIVILAQAWSISLYAQIGRVGINTTVPKAMLHVKDSSVVFTGFLNVYGSAGATPVSGPGARMMWYADRAAFRAGLVNYNDWNKDSIGAVSFATGSDTRAKGNFSTAMGTGTIASGGQSFAIGSSTIASGLVATSMGASTVASGTHSTATGFHTEASGNYSFSSGYITKASGAGSFAAGFTTVASGLGSIAFGDNNIASGNESVTFGKNLKAKSFACMALGQFNDTTNMNSAGNWLATDPVFVIAMELLMMQEQMQ